MFRHLYRDRRGAIAVLSAFVLVGVIGVSALAVEFGRGLLRRVEDQRVADIAAYSGALVYQSTSSTSSATSAVGNIVALNGLPSGDAASQVVASPSGDGNQAVEVTVTTSDPLLLARVLTTSTSLPVSATAYAEIKAGSPACIIALDSAGTGVHLSGGTSVSAPACAVASNNTVSEGNCGDSITTPLVGYDSGTPPFLPSGCSSFIMPPAGTSSVRYVHQTTADPLGGSTAVATATGRLATVAALASPSGPATSTGTNVAFGYSTSTTQSAVTADGCSASWSSPVWTVTCTGNGPFNFGNITLSGGITVNFNTGGSASAVYNFNEINDSGTALNFGPGTYSIAGGVLTGGGSTTSFGAGTFNIGAGTFSCNGSTGYSICNPGTSLTFGGPSTFVLAGGVYNGGGESLTLGSGTANSFDIGKAKDGYAIYVGGGANTTLADATGGSDLFETAGNIGSSGGSCLWLSAAAEHDINGYISLSGGTTLGAGIWTVSDYVAFGNSNGGDVTCGGTSIGVDGSDVTIVVGATTTPSSGSCVGQGFCVASGFSNVTLTAPTSGTMEDLAVIGPTSLSNTAGASFTEGASNTNITGAFYFPHGPVSLSGGASVGSTGCLELIGSDVSLSGGTTLASACAGLNATQIGQGVALVE